MRHGRKINTLSRTASHRKSLMANMAVSLLRHKRIQTTVAKAKVLRKYVEPLITRAKTDTTHSRRVVFSYLRDKAIIGELYEKIAEKIGQRPGGYTRIVRLGYRKGDSAEVCMIELVDFNPWTTTEKDPTSPKSKRSRRGSKKERTNSSASAADSSLSQPEANVKLEEDTTTDQHEELAKSSENRDNATADLVERNEDKTTSHSSKEEREEDNASSKIEKDELSMKDSSTLEETSANLTATTSDTETLPETSTASGTNSDSEETTDADKNSSDTDKDLTNKP